MMCISLKRAMAWLAGLAALTSLPANAQTSNYGDAGAWTIRKSAHECSMIAAFPREVRLLVRFDARRDEAVLVIADPSFLSADAGREFDLDVTLVAGAARVMNFDQKRFQALPVSGEFRGIASMFDGRSFLQAVAKSSGIALWRGGADVGKFSLQGSSAAVAMLRKCAAEVAARSPSDPLE